MSRSGQGGSPPSLYPSRRSLLNGLLLGSVALAGVAREGGHGALSLAAGTVAAPLTSRPPTLSNPIVVDLSRFDPTGLFPGWNGSAPSQSSRGMYPQDRDLLVKGHETATWKGDGFIRGGRNVVWQGGTYDQNIWLRNFTGDACVEGALVRFENRPAGAETGDGISLVPDARSAGRSRISILNCRVEGVDGNRAGLHGDIFQMPAMYDAPSGYCATPQTVTIERLTGSTGYQGLFLAAQQFGRAVPACQRVTLIDVNLRKLRSRSMDTLTQESPHGINLLWLLDGSPDKGGDRPYPKVFRNLYLEPIGNEDLNSLIYPRIGAAPLNRLTRSNLQPSISASGRTARFPREMMLDGVINYGRPPGGDFAWAADAAGRGGYNIPGRGYRSPGYR